MVSFNVTRLKKLALVQNKLGIDYFQSLWPQMEILKGEFNPCIVQTTIYSTLLQILVIIQVLQ